MRKRDLIFGNSELNARLRAECEEVLKLFDAPDMRLACFFDDQDTPDLTSQIGPLYRGLFSTVKECELILPDHLLDVLMDYAVVPRVQKYDQFIYVRNTTCETVPGTVITLAHELTHCSQRNTAPKVWWANTLLDYHLADLDWAAYVKAKAWDIPIEHEAQLNSRRIALEILGETITDAHATRKIEVEHDPDKWRFFQSLSVSATYDLLEATKPWIERYREGLQKIDQPIEPEVKIDFSRAEWWR